MNLGFWSLNFLCKTIPKAILTQSNCMLFNQHSLSGNNMSGILLSVGDIKTNEPKTLPSNSSHHLRETGYTVKQRAGVIIETYAKVGGKKRKLLTLLSGGQG